MLDQLDPQAKVLLEQLAASTTEELLPHQPWNLKETMRRSRTTRHGTEDETTKSSCSTASSRRNLHIGRDSLPEEKEVKKHVSQI